MGIYATPAMCRECEKFNGWDELEKENKEIEDENKWYRKEIIRLKEEIGNYIARAREQRARLETAERLVLQGGAGHDAIVKKAAELTKQRDALLEALNISTVGLEYCESNHALDSKDKEVIRINIEQNEQATRLV